MKKFENLLLDGKPVDITVDNGLISAIDQSPNSPIPQSNNRTIEQSDISPARPVVPAFYNCHTHLAMNLLRGFADDLELMPWLQEHIWPAEAHLTDDIVYAGTRLAILEMIRCGTVFANDMYWYAPAVARAAEEMGIRCAVSMQTIETGGPGHNDPKNIAANKALEGLPRSSASRVFTTLAPHAIYTVCENSLRELAARAKAEDTFIHVHVAETRFEVDTCLKEHDGRTPVRYLADCGLLGPKTIMAHCVHLTDDDIRIIKDTGAVICENQQSNMKLVSGLFPFKRAVEQGGCRASIGTDGASSNNALSMFAEMKCAALAAKIESGDPTAAPAETVYRLATRGGAQAFGLDAGEVRVGAAADFVILKPDALPLVPGFNRTSDLVYAADPSSVDTVVCAGRTLMQNGIVPGEAEIIAAARRAAAALTSAV